MSHLLRSWRASATNRQNGGNRQNDRTATPPQQQQRNQPSTTRPEQSTTPQPSSQSQVSQPQSSQSQPSQQAPQPVANVWANRRASNVKNASTNGGGPTPAQVVTNGASAVTPAPATTSQATEEKQTSIGGFNRDEVKEYFKKAYQDAIAGDTTKQALYRAPKEVAASSNANNNSSSSTRPAWGAISNPVSQEQDFLVQLAKQLAAAEGHERGG